MITTQHVVTDDTHSQDYRVTLNGYQNWWLLIQTKTTSRIWVNGEYKEYPEYCAVLFPPHTHVDYGAASDTFIYHWITFFTDEDFSLNVPIPFGIPIPLPFADYSYHIMKQLAVENFFSFTNKKTSIECFMQILFNKLSEASKQITLPTLIQALHGLRRTIQNNPSRSWTIGMMAEQLHISVSYLHTLYKNEFGITCMDDVIHNRIAYAKKLLKNSDMSVKEIIIECGYQNSEYFFRQFRKNTGMTPLQYRNSIE